MQVMLTPSPDEPALANLYFPMGLVIGVAAAAPVGPVNLLVIQRALCGTLPAALLIGLAAATGDALFAAVAGFGMAALQRLVGDYASALRIGGGVAMLAFALVLWRAAPHLETGRRPPPASRVAAAALTMTVTNPATLLFFLASFGAVGFVAIGHDTWPHAANALQVVLGVFFGSMAWWLAVCGLARYLRKRISDRHLRMLNHATAIVLVLFGVLALAAGLATALMATSGMATYAPVKVSGND